jgi:hypothetical protein
MGTRSTYRIDPSRMVAHASGSERARPVEYFVLRALAEGLADDRDSLDALLHLGDPTLVALVLGNLLLGGEVKTERRGLAVTVAGREALAAGRRKQRGVRPWAMTIDGVDQRAWATPPRDLVVPKDTESVAPIAWSETDLRGALAPGSPGVPEGFVEVQTIHRVEHIRFALIVWLWWLEDGESHQAVVVPGQAGRAPLEPQRVADELGLRDRMGGDIRSLAGRIRGGADAGIVLEQGPLGEVRARVHLRLGGDVTDLVRTLKRPQFYDPQSGWVVSVEPADEETRRLAGDLLALEQLAHVLRERPLNLEDVADALAHSAMGWADGSSTGDPDSAYRLGVLAPLAGQHRLGLALRLLARGNPYRRMLVP